MDLDRPARPYSRPPRRRQAERATEGVITRPSEYQRLWQTLLDSHSHAYHLGADHESDKDAIRLLKKGKGKRGVGVMMLGVTQSGLGDKIGFRILYLVLNKHKQ